MIAVHDNMRMNHGTCFVHLHLDVGRYTGPAAIRVGARFRVEGSFAWRFRLAVDERFGHRSMVMVMVMVGHVERAEGRNRGTRHL